MPENNIDISAWVLQASPELLEFRQAVHTILLAIATSEYLQPKMVVRGGILLATRYQSSRFTKDIDLATRLTLDDIGTEIIREEFNKSLALVSEMLDYGLDCRVQRCNIQPSPEATFPNIDITIGYAYKGGTKHKRLLAGQSSTTVSIDYNLNESIVNTDRVELNDAEIILAFAKTDLIAEKYRALLQQESRNRTRRQDVYDIHYLLETNGDLFDEIEKTKVYDSLIEKSCSREIYPDRTSISSPAVYERAKREYPSLAEEVEDLPDFDLIFPIVKEYYETLPWPTIE